MTVSTPVFGSTSAPLNLTTQPAAASALLATPLTAAPVAPASGSSLLFVDSQVSDYQQLVAGVAAGTEVYVLDGAQDAIGQITNALMGRSGIESLQIVSHGKSGGLQLGESWLDLQSLPSYVGQLKSWGAALSESADLLLYGCNVGQNAEGRAFVNLLAQATGADVAASDDLTGSATLGGNWDLEVRLGAIESSLAIYSDVLEKFQGILPIAVTQANSTTLLNTLLGTATGLSNFTTSVTGDAAAFGTFSTAPFDFTSGIVLSTGAVSRLSPGGTGVDDFTPNGVSGDAAQFNISFDADGADRTLFFKFVFASSENAGSTFSDPFQLLLNGVNLAKLSDGKAVNVTNVTSTHPDYVINSGTNLTAKWYTKSLVFSGQLLKNAQNTLSIQIADTGDGIIPSSVFIQGDSLGTVPPPQNPIISLPTTTSLVYKENDLAIQLDSSATVLDSDSANFDTGTLTVTRCSSF
jgi:hypothetical protein